MKTRIRLAALVTMALLSLAGFAQKAQAMVPFYYVTVRLAPSGSPTGWSQNLIGSRTYFSQSSDTEIFDHNYCGCTIWFTYDNHGGSNPYPFPVTVATVNATYVDANGYPHYQSYQIQIPPGKKQVGISVTIPGSGGNYCNLDVINVY